MSHKQAKQLRKMVKARLKDLSSPTEYIDRVVKTVYIPTSRLDDKGNAIMMPQQRVQRTLHPMCDRSLIQKLKKVS